MIPLNQASRSSVLKKLLTALTGLGLVVFIILHLAGNLFLYRPGSEAFNGYASSLDHLGKIKTIAEIGLILLFGLHIVNSLALKWTNTRARPVKYQKWRSKGGPTPSNLSSRNMAVTGIILLAFLILHVLQFTLGPGMAEGYVTHINGEPVRDLYLLVYQTFQNPIWVGVYVFAMLFLGFHLRHGFWSMWQSAGTMSARYSRPVQLIAVAFAVVMALGFLGIPIFLHCHGGG